MYRRRSEHAPMQADIYLDVNTRADIHPTRVPGVHT